MADPWAGYTDKGPQVAPAPQADPWAGWRDAGPGSPTDEERPTGLTFADRAKGAFDPSSFRPTELLAPTQEREVPAPDASKQSIPEMMRNVSQRARNTASGTGPGSVAGIPGPYVAGGLAGLAPVASVVARGAAAAAKQLPATALAATAGYVGSHFGDQPEWVKEFIHNLLLHVQLSAGGKK
jgi:hypothetical protein